MRITEKKENGFYELKNGREIYGEEHGIRLVQIVGKYEDIEEQLGIDLITLFKALKNGCWIRKGFYGTCYLDGEPIFISSGCLHLNLFGYYSEKENDDGCESEYQEALCLFDLDYEIIDNIARVKDYGKTWSLTKEELL